MKIAMALTMLILFHYQIATPDQISFGIGMVFAWEIGRKAERYLTFRKQILSQKEEE